ncbi:MAG: DNA replication initiation control protein YabA [Lactobacillus sp.]|nr:DNA replication initiation control protein YabA [Lactobacillus sp.]
MDPYSQLDELHRSLEKMTNTVAQLENDILDALKENTELKVENQLLREKINKLSQTVPDAKKRQPGLESLRSIYKSGYHICNMYYGSHRQAGNDCIFCLDILDNFVNAKDRKQGGKHAKTK